MTGVKVILKILLSRREKWRLGENGKIREKMGERSNKTEIKGKRKSLNGKTENEKGRGIILLRNEFNVLENVISVLPFENHLGIDKRKQIRHIPWSENLLK